LGDQPLRVGALDESGQEKRGVRTAGTTRQHMGCAGRVANGVNTVSCSYATPGGHALVSARIYVPEEQLTDTGDRAAPGIPAGVEFRTKPQLAQDILADMTPTRTARPSQTCSPADRSLRPRRDRAAGRARRDPGQDRASPPRPRRLKASRNSASARDARSGGARAAVCM
jgi:hypothetical protein